MRARGSICAGFLIAALGCGESGAAAPATTSHGATGAKPATTRVINDEAPGGEMILGLAIPDIAGGKARDAGPRDVPGGRDELRATFDKALAENRLEEAIATADVLALMFPDDAEILELRARALQRQGDAEGGARDLARCCALGRPSCCGDKAP